MMNLDKEVSTKVTFKIETHDYDLGKNVTVNKTFDKLNRKLANLMVLDELGNLIVDAIGGNSLLDIVITKQDSAL